MWITITNCFAVYLSIRIISETIIRCPKLSSHLIFIIKLNHSISLRLKCCHLTKWSTQGISPLKLVRFYTLLNTTKIYIVNDVVISPCNKKKTVKTMNKIMKKSSALVSYFWKIILQRNKLPIACLFWRPYCREFYWVLFLFLFFIIIIFLYVLSLIVFLVINLTANQK